MRYADEKVFRSINSLWLVDEMGYLRRHSELGRTDPSMDESMGAGSGLSGYGPDQWEKNP